MLDVVLGRQFDCEAVSNIPGFGVELDLESRVFDRFVSHLVRDPELPSSTRDPRAPAINSSGVPDPQVNFFGIRLVGRVVMNCPQTKTPIPKNMHQNH